MVSLLLITHGNIGADLLESAKSIMGKEIMPAGTISVNYYPDIDKLTTEAETLIQRLDQGDGVMVMTDLVGATPHNIALRLAHLPISIVSGLNLSMLLKVINYQQCSLRELTDKAQQGGHIGITCSHQCTQAARNYAH